MKAIFTGLTRLSLRYRVVTLALVVIISVLGVISVTQLKQELLPSIEFPQTVILSQVSGLTSEQVLTVVTERVETALQTVSDIVNTESTTTGAFGSVVIARNNFGVNAARLQAEIRAALDSVWLPQRRIEPAEGQDAQAFAAGLLADLTPETLIFIQERDANFLFQLSPEVWGALSDESVKTVLSYLASQKSETSGEGSALAQLIEQEVVPQLDALDVVATVNINGGQELPGETTGDTPTPAPEDTETSSLLLQLSPDVWRVVSAKAGLTGALNQDAVTALEGTEFPLPESAPALPESWLFEHFKDASDLLEMGTLTRTVAAALNNFYETGQIVGALGQTDDLTPDTIQQLLAIDPTLVEYLKAEHLAALPEDVFAALPAEFIAGLDGFTRDELAARALAATVTGEDAQPVPVELPTAWQISPPQLISFSFDDLPLATFSISTTEELAPAESATSETPTDEKPDEEAVASPETPTDSEIPEGPALPPIFALLGGQFGATLDTADDLINLQLPAEFAEQFGASTLRAADLFNFIILLGDPENLPPGTPASPIPINPGLILGGISADAMAFIEENDPTFVPNLSDGVYAVLSDEVLALPEFAPPLASDWDALANQPQFAERPLNTAADLIAIGDGSAASVLNTINETVPEEFAGYEVRLFDSLTPAVTRYLTLQQADFFSQLDSAVLLKLNPTVLATLPEDVTTGLDEATATQVAAIAAGEQESAAQLLASRYTSEAPPADPNAPAINADWALIGDFLGIELDTADDFFRAPAAIPDVTGFFNGLFDSAQGAAFAPNLIGNLPDDAFAYMAERDPKLLTDLRSEALQLLPESILTTLPADIQAIAVSGGTPFKPTAAITRTNGNSSLLLTIFKTDGANTVEAFHIVEEKIHEIVEQDPNLRVDVSFEQASFIEESISGVAREGGLGGIFAIVVILIFLSTGVWSRSPRRTVGFILLIGFVVALIAVVLSNAGATGGDFGAAFEQTDVIVKLLLIIGAVAGALIIVWPGDLPYPAWRSTLVVGVSIPLSILMTFVLMNWFAPTVHRLLEPAAEGSSILAFILRLFPASLTLNIMTLSGLTVAIGRVVDDSIVVLENIFRQIQEGGNKRDAIIAGTRDVSVAIFSATVITVVVFLPLGMTGGIISEFFLPFGLAVTYALLSSFLVAITVVPVMAFLFISGSEVSEEEHEGWLERLYVPSLRWALSSPLNKAIVLIVAVASFVIGGLLFATRPTTFLPDFGEPQIGVSVEMPAGTKIIETNEKVEQLEAFIASSIDPEAIGAVQTTVGSGGASIESLLGLGGGVSENIANITIAVEAAEQLDALAQTIRTESQSIFGEGNVTVSAASLADQGFGGFELVLYGPAEELVAVNQTVIDALNSVPGITNATSDLAVAGAAAGDGPATYIRIDGQSAVSFGAELETENTLGVTAEAIQKIESLPELPDTIVVSQGFNSQLQTEGFQSLGLAMGIAIVLVVIILIVTFGSVVHWFDIILSIVVAPVGAAVFLTLTDRVLGISAMIGLLMLIGIVVTNAVVLIDRVQSNRYERGMSVYDALIEAGGRRLRPILMTAIATVFALLPLAIGLSKGAIIASELGTVVIGGLVSSTLLTLIVVPVMYSLLAPVHKTVMKALGRREGKAPAT